MVRHHNIADQAYTEFLPQHVQRLDHHLLGRIMMKETESPITRDGPEVDVPGFVVASQVRRHRDNISRSAQDHYAQIRVSHVPRRGAPRSSNAGARISESCDSSRVQPHSPETEKRFVSPMFKEHGPPCHPPKGMA